MLSAAPAAPRGSYVGDDAFERGVLADLDAQRSCLRDFESRIFRRLDTMSGIVEALCSEPKATDAEADAILLSGTTPRGGSVHAMDQRELWEENRWDHAPESLDAQYKDFPFAVHQNEQCYRGSIDRRCTVEAEMQQNLQRSQWLRAQAEMETLWLRIQRLDAQRVEAEVELQGDKRRLELAASIAQHQQEAEWLQRQREHDNRLTEAERKLGALQRCADEQLVRPDGDLRVRYAGSQQTRDRARIVYAVEAEVHEEAAMKQDEVLARARSDFDREVAAAHKTALAKVRAEFESELRILLEAARGLRDSAADQPDGSLAQAELLEHCEVLECCHAQHEEAFMTKYASARSALKSQRSSKNPRELEAERLQNQKELEALKAELHHDLETFYWQKVQQKLSSPRPQQRFCGQERGELDEQTWDPRSDLASPRPLEADEAEEPELTGEFQAFQAHLDRLEDELGNLREQVSVLARGTPVRAELDEQVERMERGFEMQRREFTTLRCLGSEASSSRCSRGTPAARDAAWSELAALRGDVTQREADIKELRGRVSAMCNGLARQDTSHRSSKCLADDQWHMRQPAVDKPAHLQAVKRLVSAVSPRSSDEPEDSVTWRTSSESSHRLSVAWSIVTDEEKHRRSHSARRHLTASTDDENRRRSETTVHGQDLPVRPSTRRSIQASDSRSQQFTTSPGLGGNSEEYMEGRSYCLASGGALSVGGADPSLVSSSSAIARTTEQSTRRGSSASARSVGPPAHGRTSASSAFVRPSTPRGSSLSIRSARQSASRTSMPGCASEQGNAARARQLIERRSRLTSESNG
mmetsp:Transcript_8461/g.21764  ORF Transcript_8461/g.21764 Transcript_8461/m.21764 type:complete len:815 (-) Transcript_8461:72-2516(-)